MIDWGKPIETVAGRKARLLCADLNRSDGYTNLVAVEAYAGHESIYCYSATGDPSSPGLPQLRNVPEKFERELWVNVYPTGGCAHDTRADANNGAGPQRLACIKTTITGHVGQFDE